MRSFLQLLGLKKVNNVQTAVADSAIDSQEEALPFVDEALFVDRKPPVQRAGQTSQYCDLRSILQPILQQDHYGNGYRDGVQGQTRDLARLYIREVQLEAGAAVCRALEPLKRYNELLEAHMLELDERADAGLLQRFSVERDAAGRRIEEFTDAKVALECTTTPIEAAVVRYESGYQRGLKDWLDQHSIFPG